ncbi:hypothetical protein ABIC88_004841 [Pseudomonas kilonensis]
MAVGLLLEGWQCWRHREQARSHRGLLVCMSFCMHRRSQCGSELARDGGSEVDYIHLGVVKNEAISDRARAAPK